MELLNIYLPIAEVTVNIAVVIALGIFTGIISGIFGLGGGIIVVPFITMLGIPVTTAVATSVGQMTAGSLASLLTYSKMDKVDSKLGLFLILGGFLGVALGNSLLTELLSQQNADMTLSYIFMALILTVTLASLCDAIKTIRRKEVSKKKLAILDSLPFKTRLKSLDEEVSPLPFILVGTIGGTMSMLLGVGGGFIMIPILLYILHVREDYISGSIQLQMFVASIISSLLYMKHGVQVDIVLLAILIFGIVIGARLGAKLGSKLSRRKYRVLLSCILTLMAMLMARNLLYPITTEVLEQAKPNVDFQLKPAYEWLKSLIEHKPQVYTMFTISFAIIAGLVAGKLKNGAKQH
ncbi:MAG: hypothetical protein K0R73_794 [Candidatus Midichloriaceae bacterium]|nr:hypothetical protein [Candidatus Midichloriaceae bacterium]